MGLGRVPGYRGTSTGDWDWGPSGGCKKVDPKKKNIGIKLGLKIYYFIIRPVPWIWGSGDWGSRSVGDRTKKDRLSV